MEKVQELIEAPLSAEELAARYRDLCDDPLFSRYRSGWQYRGASR